jgi:hypothetical protein
MYKPLPNFKRAYQIPLVAMLLLCLWQGAWAQNTVQGKVTDENGEALPGVNVQLQLLLYFRSLVILHRSKN